MMILVNFVTVLNVMLLLWAWTRKRCIYLLPSSWILLFSVIFYMIPAPMFLGQIEAVSPYTPTAVLYCGILVFLGTLLNLRESRVLLEHLDSIKTSLGNKAVSQRRVDWLLTIVLLLIAFVAAIYLLHVPFSETGLYGLTVDPGRYAELRENSLKLLNVPYLQYAYLTAFSCLCPFAFVLLLERTRLAEGAGRFLIFTVVLTFLSFFVLLTGTRVGLVNLAIVGLLYSFLYARMQINWKYMALGSVVLLAIPMTLTALRSQGSDDISLSEYFLGMVDRVFVLPMLISGWYVEYAEYYGGLGFDSAIGVNDKTDWSNEIALLYLDRKEPISFQSVTTPTSFYFNNYLYFGWFGLMPSVIALKFIDVPVYLMKKLHPVFMIPFVATMLYFSQIFLRAGFGVSLISHGYFFLMILLIFMAIQNTKSASFQKNT